jgi:hypothetical protein
MNEPKKLLAETTVALVEGQEVLERTKRKLKKVKGDPLKKANAKLAIKAMAKAVENIEARRELLKSQAEPSEAT